jgi:bifunctional N-acetylglucosamine-1-phosphate-uridyltransferase/glucosamine-1-phosphate-acetyltransferase GlmU-like protein
VQEEQLGTGHAVMMAKSHLEGFDGNVVVLYGDMPLISPETIARLIEAREEGDNVKASIVTMVLDNPPKFGRIIRDENGEVLRSIEDKDCTPEQRLIKEVNVGMYCFESGALLRALQKLSPENAQNEYYLTDTLEIMRDEEAGRIVAVRIENLEETLGINDPRHLQFAESLTDIRFAESLYDLIDATVAMARTKKNNDD